MKLNKKKLLLIEDNKVDQMAFKRFADKHGFPYQYDISSSVEEAKNALKSKKYDVIISDYSLGDGTAFDILKDHANLPLIITTGTGNEEIAVKAMKKGAYDYLIKDIDGYYLKVLPVTVENALNRFQIESELREHHENLEKLVEERTSELKKEILDRRQTEEELIMTEEKYRCLFEQSPVSLWEEDYSDVKIFIDELKKSGIKDFKKYFEAHPEVISKCAKMVKVISFNKESKKLFAISSLEQLNKGLTSFFFEESFPGFIEQLAAVSEGRIHFEIEKTLKTMQGERKHVIVSWNVPEGSEETFSRVIISVIDITERKKAEEKIRKLSHSVQQSPAIVIISDAYGTIEYVNPKFEEVTGYTANEVIGKTPNILKSGDTTPEEYEELWKIIKTGGEWHGEFHNKKKNGELYWESASISPIKDSAGKTTHFVAIKEDISERKAIEKRLQESHNRLRSLAERLQTIREEERATIAREIHDDLGQSLTALKMDISWMKNTPDMDEDAQKAQLDMMLDLTNSTLQSVKRIASELRPGILDDLGLIAAIEWQAAEFQSRYKIKCNLDINESEVIMKDEISIAVFRIFQESLTNVARHSGASVVNINLNICNNNKLIMEIADNGVGIDEEQINDSKSFGLLGMRERVHFLKGEIEITGEYGKGTTVRLSVDY